MLLEMRQWRETSCVGRAKCTQLTQHQRPQTDTQHHCQQHHNTPPPQHPHHTSPQQHLTTTTPQTHTPPPPPPPSTHLTTTTPQTQTTHLTTTTPHTQTPPWPRPTSTTNATTTPTATTTIPPTAPQQRPPPLALAMASVGRAGVGALCCMHHEYPICSIRCVLPYHLFSVVCECTQTCLLLRAHYLLPWCVIVGVVCLG